MKSQTLINVFDLALLIVVGMALIISFWICIPALATVSWNG